MNTHKKQFRRILGRMCQNWISRGLPSRARTESTAEKLTQWKHRHHINGLWAERPLMVTATVDDGIGQGIDLIERYAKLIGLDVIRIGLYQKPSVIINRCKELQPDFLGLTILQLDSDDVLAKIGRHRPQKTCLIAGGPVFNFDPDMAKACNVDYVAPNVAYFVEHMLNRAPHSNLTC